MTLLTKIILGAFLAVLVLLGLQQCKQTSLEREVAALRLAPMKAAADTAARRVDTVKIQLAARIDTVTRRIAKVRVDTFMLAPKTAAETTKAVTQLPTLVAEHDTLQRSCSALALTCAQYRTAAEARFGADSVYRVSLEAQVASQRPSRLGAGSISVSGRGSPLAKVRRAAVVEALLGARPEY